ncbi:MAG: hypothetical protein ABTQ31_09240 [Rhizobiaceae bacterium]
MSAGRRIALAALAPAACLPAGQALAHASQRGYVLLLPTGYYLAGGALAVAASFAALALLNPRRLQNLLGLRLPLGRVPDRWRFAASLASFLLLAVLVAAGFLGSRDPLSNPLPLVVWSLLWVGLTIVQGVFGNLWRWLDPWYAPWRMLSPWAGRAPLKPPAWLGCWPAVALFLAFVWFELIDPAPDDPYRLAVAVGLYWLATFAAMLALGHAEWSRRGEFLSVFFGLIARLGMVERTPDGRLLLALPGGKLAGAPALSLPAMTLLLVALASVSFDGLSQTFFWLGLNGVNPLELPGRTALTGINGVGLALACLLLGGLFLLCVWLGERMGGGERTLPAAGLLVWSIAPIALAYHVAHYLTVLLVDAQYALVAISDPFSRGWNLFGTAYMPVRAAVAAGSDAAWTIWNVQAAAIVGGHVVAVVAAHLLAARLHPCRRAALVSQVPLNALMIAYTVFGLWLLSSPAAG